MVGTKGGSTPVRTKVHGEGGHRAGGSAARGDATHGAGQETMAQVR